MVGRAEQPGIGDLERAVAEVEGPGERCDALIGLGEALLRTSDPRRVVEGTSSAAYGLAVALDDDGRACRAAELALRALSRYGGGTVAGTAEHGAVLASALLASTAAAVLGSVQHYTFPVDVVSASRVCVVHPLDQRRLAGSLR